MRVCHFISVYLCIYPCLCVCLFTCIIVWVRVQVCVGVFACACVWSPAAVIAAYEPNSTPCWANWNKVIIKRTRAHLGWAVVAAESGILGLWVFSNLPSPSLPGARWRRMQEEGGEEGGAEAEEGPFLWGICIMSTSFLDEKCCSGLSLGFFMIMREI